MNIVYVAGQYPNRSEDRIDNFTGRFLHKLGPSISSVVGQCSHRIGERM